MATLRRRRGGKGSPNHHPNAPEAAKPAAEVPSEWLFPGILLALSIATRFWRIDTPDSVVFDEYHFGKFINWYNDGSYFFDIHPPLGKLTLYAAGKLFGYDHTVCEYERIHQVYKPECKFLILRYTAATFGCLLPPLTYFITRELGASRPAGFLAGSLIVFDMLNLIESRLILVDSQLMFYCALSLFLALKVWKRLNMHTLKKTVMRAKEENLWCLALGLACGAAVSIKWTALATPGLIAVESTFALFFLHREVPMVMLLKVAAVVIAQYALWFAFHFWLLPNTGSGDAFMPIEFQRTLVNNTHYNPNAPEVPFWYIFPELNREMLDANARIDVVHAWASRYHQWIVNARGVLYWSGSGGGRGMSRKVYLMGNPIALWLCLGGIVAFVLFSFAYMRCRNTQSRAAIVARFDEVKPGAVGSTMAVCMFCIVCYLLNLLPYMGVQRSAFCYHYMPGLFYAEVLLAVFVDRLCRPYHVLATQALLVAVVVGFVYWCPWVYALEISNVGHEARRWMRGWQ